MESRMSLALANKLQMMFEKEDKFLTYPLGVGFDDRYLSFMKEPSASGLTLQEQLNDKGDFARLMNLIPQDSALFSPDTSRFLWNEIKNVLVSANYAKSALTDAETVELNKAIDFLWDEQTAPDGNKTPVYSPSVTRYYEYKTSYEATEKTYLDEKITVETTTGAEGDRLKQQWNAYREKQLREAKDKALQDWTTMGQKLKVEECQAVQRRLEPRKFLNLNGQSYLNDIALSEIPDLNGLGIGFYTTFFSPIDAFDKGTNWLKITLTKEEINSLVQSAPASLKSIFSPTAGATDTIDGISLEYNNIPVLRPWYHPELFESRCWQMGDGRVVSDGNTPRKGTIPAYISSILAVRNILVTRKKTTQQQPVVLPILGMKPLAGLQFTRAPQIAVAAQPAVLTTKPVAHMAISPQMMAPTAAPIQKPLQAAPIQPALANRAMFLDAPQVQRARYIDAKYIGTTIKTPSLTIPPKRPEPPPATPADELVTEPYSLSGVVVLAYVCKRVPKSPDPDKTLTWGV
jgi:hypothetical protein